MLRLSADDSSETVHSGILTRGSFIRPMIADSPPAERLPKSAEGGQMAALQLQRFRRESVGIAELVLEMRRRSRVGVRLAVVAIVIGGRVCERRKPDDDRGRKRE